ncbi:heavy metal-associated isoprenylated plant protein 39-like [Benincasa hispida]|uniref:heavy metal-associated isoprenylated plant protein 39-like n=1 Tax=Benincasa hispida TaxID=102211 RepID=UPI0018FFA60C|nr:heavy metal-associated isoprenylated plant protein 39-like [Benincasa hispida]
MVMKVVLKVEVQDGKAKQKAMKAVSTLPGINSIMMDMKERKMTVIGEVDPVEVVEKLKKFWFAEILTVGPENQDIKKPPPPPCIPYPYYYPTYYIMQEENPNPCVLC